MAPKLAPDGLAQVRIGRDKAFAIAPHAIGSSIKTHRHLHQRPASGAEAALPGEVAELRRYLSIMIPAGRIDVD
jgi:hypothetical protein